MDYPVSCGACVSFAVSPQMRQVYTPSSCRTKQRKVIEVVVWKQSVVEPANDQIEAAYITCEPSTWQSDVEPGSGRYDMSRTTQLRDMVNSRAMLTTMIRCHHRSSSRSKSSRPPRFPERSKGEKNKAVMRSEEDSQLPTLTRWDRAYRFRPTPGVN